jgi:hypothetical protein
MHANVSTADTKFFSDQGHDLRVLGTMKGLWQLMGLPSQEHVFS